MAIVPIRTELGMASTSFLQPSIHATKSVRVSPNPFSKVLFSSKSKCLGCRVSWSSLTSKTMETPVGSKKKKESSSEFLATAESRLLEDFICFFCRSFLSVKNDRQKNSYN